MKWVVFFTVAAMVGPVAAAPVEPSPPQQQAQAQQFRLVFLAFNGDPRDAKTLEFQIDTLDVRQPSNFLKLGDTIPGTDLKLTKFESKEIASPEPKDVSELTVTNVKTGATIVMVIRKPVNFAGGEKR